MPRTGLTSTKRGSMREVVSEVAFGIFRAIVDGIIKGLCEINIVHPPLETQALFRAEDVPVRRSVGGVVAGDVFPLAG